VLRDLGTPCLIHQPKYNMFERTPEEGLLDVLVREGIGGIAFTPLAQGMLTGRYLNGIPADSRAGHDPRFLKPDNITADKLERIRKLDALAKDRGQTLAQMALAWVLRQPGITSALIGASKVSQIDDNLGALKNLKFAADELAAIDAILA
jgi:L-glyceraldehyde 3-phosphate reductase